MTDERITAYLLNELSEQDAQRFEEECFAQGEWPEVEIECAEEDLIQAYLKNELSRERRRRFEKHYLITDARRERLLLARSFLLVACSAPVEQPKLTLTQKLSGFFRSAAFAPRFAILRFATILVTLGLATTLLWFAFRTRTPQTFAHLSLINSIDKRATGGSTKNVKLPLTEDALRISLALPEPGEPGTNYRVQWEAVKGPLENLDIEQQDAQAISVVIPAEKLTRGQFVLKLFRKNPDGTEENVPGNYFFNAE